jgi:drug/metabolite transporter (DMT)-like permease
MSTAETFTSAGLWSAITRTPALSTSHIGVICAWSAVIIYASSNSIVSLLVSIGEASPVAGGRNAITYMNLLLLGSLISIIPMAVLFRRDLTRANVRILTARNWGFLTLSALLSSAVTPGLFFYALANTSVTNIVLITRIEPPLFLLAAWFFLGEYFSRRALAAGLVALSGAVVMISLREGGGLGAIGTGEWAAVAATLAYIASTLVTRTSLRDIPIGIFSVGRTIMGSAMYFALVCMIVGPDAFRDIFSPVLWTWIWLYAGIVIVLAQVTWNIALKHACSDVLSLATSFSPLAAILIAMALLGETAGPGFVPGAALIVLAIILSRRPQTGIREGLMIAAARGKEGIRHLVPALASITSRR